jgi:MFS superfamily sulfate permease-like transporter
MIALTPEPVLAAIVIHALARGLSLQPLGRYFIWRRDRLLVMCAVAAVLVLGVLDGLLLSVAISVVLMLARCRQRISRCSGGSTAGTTLSTASTIPMRSRSGDVDHAAERSAVFRQCRADSRCCPALDPSPTGTHGDPQSGRVPDLDGTSIEAMQDFCRVHKRASD